MELLTGKTAVITGGSAGVGLATAKRFVEEGAYVFINGRSQAELDAAVREIGGNVTGVQGDGSKQGDRDRLYAAVADAERRRVDHRELGRRGCQGRRRRVRGDHGGAAVIGPHLGE
jgi:NAD(P)-dependent dehydrogenase (short-subunit alcohol dehydrogenase family)